MTDDKDIGGRLKAARKHAGYATATSAATALGIKYQTYAAHENGSRGVARACEQYARRFKVSLDWLLRGKGAGPGETSAEPDDLAVEIPLVSTVSAGALRRNDLSDEQIGTIRIGPLPPGDWIALRVSGDSMDKVSPPDSIILVNRADHALVPNGCYVIDDGEGYATYKRYRPNPDRFEPVSMNDQHQPIFPENTPTIIGRVRRSILEM